MARLVLVEPDLGHLKLALPVQQQVGAAKERRFYLHIGRVVEQPVFQAHLKAGGARIIAGQLAGWGRRVNRGWGSHGARLRRSHGGAAGAVARGYGHGIQLAWGGGGAGARRGRQGRRRTELAGAIVLRPRGLSAEQHGKNRW